MHKTREFGNNRHSLGEKAWWEEENIIVDWSHLKREQTIRLTSSAKPQSYLDLEIWRLIVKTQQSPCSWYQKGEVHEHAICDWLLKEQRWWAELNVH